MRVCRCATCVALAAVLILPAVDHWLHQPHSRSASPREQATPLDIIEVASSSSRSSSARAVHRQWTNTPESIHALHPR